MKLSVCLHQFFDQFLPLVKGVSKQTIKTYRDTFTLFLPYAADQYNIKVVSLTVEQKKLIEHTQSDIKLDPRIEELWGEENREETLVWLDSL